MSNSISHNITTEDFIMMKFQLQRTLSTVRNVPSITGFKEHPHCSDHHHSQDTYQQQSQPTGGIKVFMNNCTAI